MLWYMSCINTMDSYEHYSQERHRARKEYDKKNTRLASTKEKQDAKIKYLETLIKLEKNRTSGR